VLGDGQHVNGNEQRKQKREQVVGAVEQGIQILQSADSHTTIWVLVKEEDMINAVNALHEAFDLSD